MKKLIKNVLDFLRERQAQKQDTLRKAENRKQIKLILKDLQ